MSDKRKTIRITIPADCVNKFNSAKMKAEDSAMIAMTDTQFASRIIQRVIAQQDEMHDIINAVVHLLGNAICENDSSITVSYDDMNRLEESIAGKTITHTKGKFSI